MTVDYPWLLVLAAVLPAVVAAALVRADRRRRARLDRLGDRAVVSRLMPAALGHPGGWRTARLAGACALIGVALAGPRWGTEHGVIRRRGIDMMLALDVSLSMEANDVKPSRLEQMKQEVRRLRALSPGDRIGLIVFAGRAYVLSPLTVDQSALDLFLDNLDPSIVGEPGTSLSSAIRLGTNLLSLDRSGADRALVVMSDGESFEPVDDITTEARRAGEKGISLVTVGFGTEQGSTIPMRAPDGSVSFKRDQNGQIVVTHYEPGMLEAAARAAHGTFIPSAATDKAARIRDALSGLRTAEHAGAIAEDRTPRFQLFLLPALLLLCLDAFLGDRRPRAPRQVLPAAAATAATVLVVLLSGCAGAAESHAAAQAYAARQYPAALALYRRAIEAGDQRPRTIYDFGTAFLAVDSVQEASDAFDRVVDLPDAELRYRALFNRGLAHLRRGLAETAHAGDDLDAALADYKKALLMRPDAFDAKWNYELALHAKERGSGGANSRTNPSPALQGQAPTPAGGLSMKQARELLASAAREERNVEAQQQRRVRTAAPPNGKDW